MTTETNKNIIEKKGDGANKTFVFRTKEVVLVGHLLVTKNDTDVIADVICDNSKGFYVPSIHKEQYRYKS